MKMLLVGVVTVLFSTPLVVSAQTTRPADQPQRDRTMERPASKEAAGLYESNDIIGTRVQNAEGKNIGEIDQLLIDRNGRVSRVVVGVGGLAGVGEKKVVVPWSDLKFVASDGKKATLMIDQAKLERAPRYERSARWDAPPAASPRTDSSVKDSDRDGKSDRTDKAPLDSTRK
jgi:sporulation protein YlmC with PRC-barrel domain